MITQQGDDSDDRVTSTANNPTDVPLPVLPPSPTPYSCPPRGSSLPRHITTPSPPARKTGRKPQGFGPRHLNTSFASPSIRSLTPTLRSTEDHVPPLPNENGTTSFSRDSSPHYSPQQALRTSLSIPNVHSRRYSPYQPEKSPIRAAPLRPVVSRSPHNYHSPELHFDISTRSSLQSAVTRSSSAEPASGTERSSVITKTSSITEISPGVSEDGGMSVDDAIDMYLDGFLDDPPQPPKVEPEDPEETKRNDLNSDEQPEEPKQNDSISYEQPDEQPKATDIGPPDQGKVSEPAPSDRPPPPPLMELTRPVLNDTPLVLNGSPPGLIPVSKLRDQYGFRKISAHVTVDQFDSWYGSYVTYSETRRQKWLALLRDSGIQETDPTTFPQRSNKIKRYVRKGIPPELRGAAWFWYAGGYSHMHRNPGLYRRLVETALRSPMDDDKEHIERDLHRTFPDNVHFKPDVASESDGSSNLKYSLDPVETPIIKALRRVLYAFSVHNSKIGYTQSLNFIAGLLLLFLPEEKAFWMLHIITSLYLPGTHEISLEGANADLWILMVVLKEALPAVYTKVASSSPTTSKSKPPAITTSTRLPDITLGLTNWLMSVFISSLPLESMLRVWDVLFYEGSRTFFRVALVIFRLNQKEILSLSDPMEIFQVVQTAPKKMIDANALLDECFARRFRLSQSRVESLRESRRRAIREDKERVSYLAGPGKIRADVDGRPRTRTGATSPLPGAWRSLKNHTFR